MKSVNRNTYAPFRDQIYEKLRNKIIFRGWGSGTILSEGELAKSFGISRTPIREAIRRLESEGLIRVIPKKGILIPKIQKKDVEEIFELREIIYSYAIKKAVENVTPRDIGRLEKIVKRAEMYIKGNNNASLVHLSMQFHELILGLAGNKRFLEIDRILKAHIIRNSSELFDANERKRIGWEGHKEIVAAIKKRNKKLACEKMREHFEKGKELLLGKMNPVSV